jgi:hypothetical protein
MITKAIIFIISALIYTLTLPFRILPDAVLPEGVENSITEVSGYLSGINTILPIDVLLQVFQAMIVLEVAILGFKGLNWVIRKIHGVN